MKLLVAIFFLLGSSVALSAPDIFSKNFHYYHGGGSYETPDGKEGNFLASLIGVKMENGDLKLTTNHHSSHGNFSDSVILVKSNSHIFDIYRDSEMVGYGYCFRVCFFNYKKGDFSIESSLHAFAQGKSKREDRKELNTEESEGMWLHIKGMKSQDGKVLKAWRMKLKRIF